VTPARLALALGACACTACGFPRPADVGDDDNNPSTHAVGGQVGGLWTGATLTLHLAAPGVDEDLPVTGNGAFSFDAELPADTAYTVTVAGSPDRHTCALTSGSGTVGGGDVTSVGVTCTGPAVDVVMSIPVDWTFDPALDVQPDCNVSVLVQEAALTVSGDELTAIHVGGNDLEPGEATPARPLDLGGNPLQIDVESGDLSRSFQLTIDRGGAAIEQALYGKADNTGSNDELGYAVSLSGDWLAVGARKEASAFRGVDQSGHAHDDDGADGSGAVYVFHRDAAGDWKQEAFIKASNTGAGDAFGTSVALYGDSLAVGARQEDSDFVGIDPTTRDHGDSPALYGESGAVYVFRRTGTTWRQEAYIKGSHPGKGHLFGHTVALDANVLAVFAYGDASAFRGIDQENGHPDDDLTTSGAVYIFRRAGTTWRQEAYIKAFNSGMGHQFGYALAFWGDYLAVGARGEGSNGSGVNPPGNHNDNDLPASGAAYIYRHTNQLWRYDAYLKSPNPSAGDQFGAAIAMSGSVVVVGAPKEDGGGRGIDPAVDETAVSSGAAYVYRRANVTWSRDVVYLKASNTDRARSWIDSAQREFGDEFGHAIALSGDVLAISAVNEDGDAFTVGGDQDAQQDRTYNAGAVYVFRWDGDDWAPDTYVKGDRGAGGHMFGSSLALSGGLLAVGSAGDAWTSTGVDPPPTTDGRATASGAVYVFR